MAQAASRHKGYGIQIMDMRKVSNFTDYFVIVTGDSTPQIRAISDEIEKTIRNKKLKPYHREGDIKGGWILIDCGPVVVHIFERSVREYYQLENLWGDAPCTQYSDNHL
jgi:ribosome-associated protein